MKQTILIITLLTSLACLMILEDKKPSFAYRVGSVSLSEVYCAGVGGEELKHTYGVTNGWLESCDSYIYVSDVEDFDNKTND